MGMYLEHDEQNGMVFYLLNTVNSMCIKLGEVFS